MNNIVDIKKKFEETKNGDIKEITIGIIKDMDPKKLFNEESSEFLVYKKEMRRFLKEERQYKKLLWHNFISKIPVVSGCIKNMYDGRENSNYKNSFWHGFRKDVVEELQKMKEHITEYEWLFNRLEDDESKRVLANILMARITRDEIYYYEANDNYHSQYFDGSILKLTDGEVFVDCGGYVGDTMKAFSLAMKEANCIWKNVYIYEPDKSNYDSLLNNCKNFDNVVCRNTGVGDGSYAGFQSGKGVSSAFSDSEGGDDGKSGEKSVSMDEDIKERVTSIKMDVEGFEQKALNGARNHIVNERPRMMICLYHNPEDLINLPRYIDTIRSDYKMYIRHYTFGYCETVLYCV